ncbi:MULTISPECIES: hypothetical protein [Mesorhizobium]|nr:MULTISPECIES: hypothetical protein [Mesorhizobium]
MLGIKSRTVAFPLDNARNKLGVRTKKPGRSAFSLLTS